MAKTASEYGWVLLEEFCKAAEAARGHYGIEECAGPAQPATEWDEIQERLTALAREGRWLLESGAALASDPLPSGLPVGWRLELRSLIRDELRVAHTRWTEQQNAIARLMVEKA